jgi:PAS domain-containing protein
MQPAATSEPDVVTELSRQRQHLLRHVAGLLGPMRALDPSSDRTTKLSGALVASLEELKVAEEELLERVRTLAEVRNGLEERISESTAMLEFAPSCLLLSDVYGRITRANRAALHLLRQSAACVESRPLSCFIAHDRRRPFRQELARVLSVQSVLGWRLELIRPTDSAVVVSAAVNVSSRPEGTRLHWCLSPLGPDHS